MPKKNTVHTVDITDLNNLGYGVCRIEGVVTFVAGAVTGDKAEVKIIKEAKDYCVARTERVLSPSPYRTEPDCPVFFRCGGCIYRHITYDYEKQLKRRYVQNAFRKAGVDISVGDVVSDKAISAYRNKVQYPVGQDLSIGYYKNKSHEITETDRCLLETEQTARITSYIKQKVKKEKIRGLRHIYLRTARGTGQIMVCFVCEREDIPEIRALANEIPKAFPEVRCIAENINCRDTNVILGDKTNILFGDGYIEDILLGLRFRISARSFYQVNHGMTQLLYKKVIELCDLKKKESFVDLYCGCGTIGLCVAAHFPDSKLYGVEIVPDAVKNARENAEINNIKNAEFICSDAAGARLDKASLVIVDPPRKGLAPELIAHMCEVKPSRIIYVSCNPDTLARDCSMLFSGGYSADTAYPFDLFPRTGHVETVVLLSRK